MVVAEGVGSLPSRGANTVESNRSSLDAWEELGDSDAPMLVSRYRILEVLGKGGMGAVYRAEHVAIRKQFAIKVLRPNSWDQRSIRRFLHEARTVSLIRHPNVVEVTDFGFADDEHPFFVMELLEGEDLADEIARVGPTPWPRTREIMLQILAALGAAHARGIIHRDIKPQNCFVVNDGEREIVKVLDFGIAKLMDPEVETETFTRTGAVMGTPHYMSPEQAKCMNLDARADVYSAGVIMYELLTGRVPWQAPGFLGVLSKALTEDIPAMAKVAPEARVEARIEAVVRRAMARDRDERYASVTEFGAAIRELSERRRPRSPGRGWQALGLGALGLLTLAGLGHSIGGQPAFARGVVAVDAGVEPQRVLAQTIDAEAPSQREPAPMITAIQAPTMPALAPRLTRVETSEPEASRPRPRVDAPRKVPRVGASPSASTELFERPDRPVSADIEAALASLEPASSLCTRVNTVYFETIEFDLAVSPAGRVTRAQAEPLSTGTPIATCVEKALLDLSFPPSNRGFRRTITISLQ